MAASDFKLLYVSRGNDARGPLAVASTRRAVAANTDGIVWHVDSAGTEAVEGAAVRLEAAAAARVIGFDIADHRATQLQPHNCEAPDLILAMSWDQVSHIWSLVPGAWDKVFTIKEFVHWAKRAPVRPPILFPNKLAEMRDKIVQAHAVRKRARADYGFWGGVRPSDLNLIDATGKGPDAWDALAKAIHALSADVVTLLRGPDAAARVAPKRNAARPKRAASRTRAQARR
jgi:protein-tyrosine-phosphatase